MARRGTAQLAYQAIRIEGGLIPADELARLSTLQTPDKTEQTDSHYGISKGLKLRDEIARFWKIALSLWVELQPLLQRQDVNAHDVTVREFLLPLLRDVLGFADLARGASVEAPGHSYNVGHAARGGQLPLIFAAHNQQLDDGAERFGEQNPETGRIRRRSPFMLAQEALNASDKSLWAMVSNGLTLRILRDNPSLTRPAYVEVDLEAMFTEELYADFTAFWLLAHASRFGKSGAEPSDCPWERWRNAGQAAGVRARDRLRDGVAEALRALGTGFLSHPANSSLRDSLLGRPGALSLSKQAFFEELLRLVYRLIFLATVEDRVDASTGQPLVFAPGTSSDVRARYLDGYSLAMLRARAARRSAHDRHHDYWQALCITFNGLERGEAALGLPALGGLFAPDQCHRLASAEIENRWLLAAIFHLGYFRESTGLTRVNYRDMGPEELGSVYESLLELIPDLQNLSHPQAARLRFVGDLAELGDGGIDNASSKGNTRKLTGSYYTPDSLVQELIKSALEPVIAATLRANPQRPAEALLQLTICDPACGSGHFLLAGARRLADEVAKRRAVGGVPNQSDYRHALRDVVSRCIFGVDKNPMAIALAKTALWLEAYTPDLPLSFLDHHLQCGDALLGVLDPSVLENGIPDEAFAVLSGDDKATASALKKQNKADLKSWKSIAAGDLFSRTELAARADLIEHLADDSLTGIAAKRDAWVLASSDAQRSVLARLADTYVAAFLAPKLPAEAPRIPLSGYMWGLFTGQEVEPDVESAASALCAANGVFHWWLAFPQVAVKGGFSVMLGNPPWERIKLQEEEFFASRSPLVARAKNKSERGKRIELLRQGLLLHTLYPDIEAAEGLSPPNSAEMQLHDEFISARRGAEAASLFAHDSRRFPLTGIGDVNTYALFAETFYQLMSPDGRAGFIVPTGIATDDSTKAFFGAIADGRLVSLYDLRTGPGLFSEIGHQRFKFCLLTLGKAKSADFLFFALRVEDLADERSHFELTPEEFRLINPNTRTCPVFRSKYDAELTKKLFRVAPVLIEERQADADGNSTLDINPWGIRFQRMFDMSTDSEHFKDARATVDDPERLPLYEAKMIHQFDHRWATYIDAPYKPDGLDTEDCNDLQKADAEYTVRPRYWVEERYVLARVARVPSRVATAWLATHLGGTDGALEPGKKLEVAVAGWVAGEIFRRHAGEPEAKKGWSAPALVDSLHKTSSELEKRFWGLASALRGIGIEGKKALSEYQRWARLDSDVALTDSELSDLAGCVTPSNASSHNGVSAEQLLTRMDELMDSRSPRWLLGWRDICRSTDFRTLISSVIPRVGVGDKFLLMSSTASGQLVAALLGCLNSLVCDYIARQKVGGTALKYFTMKQLAVFPPERYSAADLAFIVPRVLELTYTSNDMRSWAVDVGFQGPPFDWTPARRARLRAELDAYYAHLYELTRDELRFVLQPVDVMGAGYPSETFRVMRTNELRAVGEYRTQRLVLEAWDRLAAVGFVGLPYEAPPRQDIQDEMDLGYSEQGVIRNESEANLGGLVLAMLRHGGEISTAALQSALSTVGMPEYVAKLLVGEELAVFEDLVSDSPDVLSTHTVQRLPVVLARLVKFGTLATSRVGSAVNYRLTDGGVPHDVTQSPRLMSLAVLVLKIESQRATQVSRAGDTLDGDEEGTQKSA